MRIRNPSLALLLGLGALLLGYPFVEQSQHARTALNLLGIVVVLLATRMIAHTQTDKRFVWGVAILPIATQLWYVVQHERWVAAWVAAMQAVFYAYVTWGYIRYMRRDEVASVDEIFAAGATFIIIVLLFACLYWLLEFAWPGSFTTANPVRAEDGLTWYEYVYFSFTTLSTTGYGDTAPVTSIARAVVMAEQFAGVMYVALVIAHLTSLAARRTR